MTWARSSKKSCLRLNIDFFVVSDSLSVNDGSQSMHGQYVPLGGLMPQYGSLAPGPPSQFQNDPFYQSQSQLISASGGSGYPPASLAPGAPIGSSVGSVGSTGSIGDEGGSAGSAGAPGPPPIQFQCPKRPNHGSEGRPIQLRANHFKVAINNINKNIQHYAIDIQPDKCPRKVNR